MAEYIERDALLSEIQTMRNQHLLSKCDGVKVERMARQLPATDVAPVVHGRWENGCVCSNCTTHCGPKNETAAIYYRYCPNCGAKMDLEE